MSTKERSEKGFDFLGYHFGPDGLSVAEKTVGNFLARAVRLYEQEQSEPDGPPLLGLYVRRWLAWVTARLCSSRCVRRKNDLRAAPTV